ncbi:MAG: class I SAM-dependent methyltransferase [Actinomycetota bacterium]|nr:class I SAM-dependent methyltransferase [Actinomycetota bacterium]
MTTAPAEIERAFVTSFLGDAEALAGYRREVEDSGLVDHLERNTAFFWDTVKGETRGGRYNTGRVTGREGYDEGVYLYSIMRALKPEVAVETGVCNGVSTAFLLLALKENGSGELHSIDYPEFAGEDYAPDEFWAGKGGAVIPAGKEPGWMIPDELKEGWKLLLGKSQDELPPLLERVGEIDFFMHDSEHSYECMSFEFGAAYPSLREGGVLIADDITENPAMSEFAAAQGRAPIPIGAKMAFLVK